MLTYIFYYVILSLNKGAPVRYLIYSWWKSDMVISSKEPLVSLGAEVVRLGLSVGKQEYGP